MSFTGPVSEFITISGKRLPLGLVLGMEENRIICRKPAPGLNSHLQMPAEPCHDTRCSAGTEMRRRQPQPSESCVVEARGGRGGTRGWVILETLEGPREEGALSSAGQGANCCRGYEGW